MKRTKGFGRCKGCGERMTLKTRSLKPGVCLDCRFENLRSQESAPESKQQQQHVIKPVVVYGEGEEWQAPGAELFGGYDFNDPNVCPLG